MDANEHESPPDFMQSVSEIIQQFIRVHWRSFAVPLSFQLTKLSDESQELIRVAMTELNLSARAYDRILKVSRTVADLQSSDEINTEHVSEAIQYRTFDRTLWV